MKNRLEWLKKSKLGGLRRQELYGNFGTLQGRSKGGQTTTKLFHDHPYLAKKVGFVIRKRIKVPRRSGNLAELFGIILGDGAIRNNCQLVISFNYQSDLEYAYGVGVLVRKLFCVSYHIYRRKDSKGADIIFGGANLVDFLLRHDLKQGNKVRNQINVPAWISENIKYRTSCVRGLMDTDGGLFLHQYQANGKLYKYMKLCFTNKSRPLLMFVFETLKILGFKAYLTGDHVQIHAKSQVIRYFSKIGSSNPKHIHRFEKHFSQSLERCRSWLNGTAC